MTTRPPSPTSKIWWARRWPRLMWGNHLRRPTKLWIEARGDCTRIWVVFNSRRLSLLSTRIEGNSFPTKGVWCTSPRASYTTLLVWCTFSRESFLSFKLNFKRGKFHSNSCMARLFFGSIIWISWQKTLYEVLFELQSAFSKRVSKWGLRVQCISKGKNQV